LRVDFLKQLKIIAWNIIFLDIVIKNKQPTGIS
jgi:hypothetical protein